METTDYQANYRSILALYDVAQELVNTVEHPETVDIDTHLDMIEPIVEGVEESAEVLTTEYAHMTEGAKGAKKIKRKNVEGALRRFFAVIDEFKRKSGDLHGATFVSVTKIVAPLVEKLREAGEQVVAIFMQVVEIALDQIMHKADVEAVKRRNQVIAAMMHQRAMTPV